MAKKAAKKVKKEKLVYVLADSDYILSAGDIESELESAALNDGEKVDIYQFIGTKTVRGGKYELV